MEFRVLGAVEVVHEGRTLDLGRRRERRLLGILLLEAGKAVPDERLVDLLWDGDGPEGARAALRAHISRLRARLDSGHIELVRSGEGYLARVDPDSVDALRFRRLVERARGRAPAAERAALLREALGLWRGPLLADAASDRLRDRIEAPWVELRLAAQTTAIELELEAGRHQELIGELTVLAAEHAYREQFTGLLMLALYRAGRQTEALQAFANLDRRMRENLGLEPGPELRDLHRRVLAADPGLAANAAEPLAQRTAKETAQGAANDPEADEPGTTGPPPRQLPAPPARLHGRERELAALDAWLGGTRAGTAPRVAAVAALVGPGGIGKTALALHWSARLARGYPDGQLYLNLRGYGPGAPLPADRALASLLRALDVNAESIPADLEDRSTLLRELLAQRRMLILLDNARDGEQVRPLLPGTGDVVVLITSRGQLRGLAALDGVQRLTLDPISADGARALLADAMSGGREGAGGPGAARRFDGAQVQRLTELCAGLPLAIRIVAERLARSGGSLLDALTVLAQAEDRLDVLSSGDDDLADMRSVLSWSYQALDPTAARAFRLLGAQAGPEITGRAAAALLGTSPARAANTLDRLVGTHLVELAGPDLYRLHDIPRAYGAELAAENAAEATEAEHRLLDWYLLSAINAMHSVYPSVVTQRFELPAPPRQAPLMEFADARAGYAWFDLVHPSLIANVTRAYELELDQHAWQLAWSMWDYFDHRAQYEDFIATHLVGLAAARRLGKRNAEGYIRHGLGLACRELRRFDEAGEHVRETLAIARELGRPRSMAAAYAGLGELAAATGEYELAREHYAQALERYVELGDAGDESAMLVNIATQLNSLGRYAEAIEPLTRARVLIERPDVARGLPDVLTQLAVAHAGCARYAEALALLDQALELNRESGFRAMEAGVLERMADVRLALGDDAAAREHLKRAYDLYRELGSPRAADLHSRLAESGG